VVERRDRAALILFVDDATHWDWGSGSRPTTAAAATGTDRASERALSRHSQPPTILICESFVGVCLFHHGLRGSASPVLTRLALSMADGNFGPPTESTPLDRSPKNSVQVITSAVPAAVQNLVQIRPRGGGGLLGKWVKYNENF